VPFDTQAYMKLIAEYLENALNFQRLATSEKNPGVKAAFEQQAASGGWRRNGRKLLDCHYPRSRPLRSKATSIRGLF
jgi:hypothetical protein